MNLKKWLQRILGNEKGVTLIELLAVIVILGIIAAVAIPSVMSNVNSAKTNTDTQNIQIITDAVNRLLSDNPGATITTRGSVQTGDGAVVTAPNGTNTSNLGDDLTQKNPPATTNGLTGGPYLNSIPTESAGSTNTYYQADLFDGSTHPKVSISK